MRQLTLQDERSLEWLEVPEPEIEGPGQALVRPLAVAACDLDHDMVMGRAPLPRPIAMGHEFVAEVVEVGEEASTPVGARVVVPFQISCGACDFCLRGQTGDCTAVPPLSTYGFGAFGSDNGGALSDLVRVPFADAMLVPVPDGVESAAVASASDNLPDAWRTVAPYLAARPGARVLVLGGGARSISLYAAAMAVALGSEAVDYVDEDADRLALAAELGANPIEGPPSRRMGPYPITVDGSVTHEGLACACRSTEAGGNCTSVSIFFEGETPLPLLEMYTTGVHFHTSRAMARASIPGVLELVASGRLSPEKVNTVVAWDDAPEALLEPHTKLVIER